MDMRDLIKGADGEDATTICVLGQKRAGKTRGMAAMGNSIKDKKAVFVDTLGAWSKVKLIREATYLEGAGGVDLARLLKAIDKEFDKSDRIVINCRGMLAQEYVRFADVFSIWAMNKGNMAMFVDEIQAYCPQDRAYYSWEMERMCMWGRNEGIEPFVMSSQRPQKANKDVLALSDLYILMRIFHNLDRNKVKDLIGMKPAEWELFEKKLMSLHKKNAFVLDTDLNIKQVVFPNVYGENEKEVGQ